MKSESTATTVTDFVATAVTVAAIAHNHQTDKRGRPYILHPIEVMSLLDEPTDTERIVALLHDVVEDSFISLMQLGHYGYSADVLEAIDAITRRKGEDYFDYIARCGENPTALRVKCADLTSNMRTLHLLDDPQEAERLREKITKKTFSKIN